MRNVQREPIRPPYARKQRCPRRQRPSGARRQSLFRSVQLTDRCGRVVQFTWQPKLEVLFSEVLKWATCGSTATIRLESLGTVQPVQQLQRQRYQQLSPEKRRTEIELSTTVPSPSMDSLRWLIALLGDQYLLPRWHQWLTRLAGPAAAVCWISTVERALPASGPPPLDSQRISRYMRLLRQLETASGQLKEGSYNAARITLDRIRAEVLADPSGIDSKLIGQLYFLHSSGNCTGKWVERTCRKVSQDLSLLRKPILQVMAHLSIHAIFPLVVPDRLLQRILELERQGQSNQSRRILVDVHRLNSVERSRYDRRLPTLLKVDASWTRDLLQRKRLPKRWQKPGEQISYCQLRTHLEPANSLRPELKGLLPDKWIDRLSIDSFKSAADKQILTAWLQWLKSVPVHQSEAQVCGWQTLLLQVCQLASARSEVANRWRGWLKSTADQMSRQGGQVELILSDEGSRQAWRRYSLFLKIGRSGQGLPKPITKSLFINSHRQAEREYLQQQNLRGTLGPPAKARLEYLERKPRLTTSSPRKVREQLIEAADRVCLQAAQRWLSTQQQRALEKMNIPWTRPLSAEEKQEFIEYLSDLKTGSREALLQALRQRAGHPHGYRTCGERNLQWLQQQGWPESTLAAWLEYPSRQICINQSVAIAGQKPILRQLKLSLSNDPLDVLWMGRPFSSCLDLRSGLHCVSAAANWMDGNKQLIVVKDDHGRMVARKLMAISQESRLLEYHLYSSIQEPDESNRSADSPPSLYDQIEAYCQDWAKAMNIQRCSQGVPQRLHGSLWYDDGPI